MLIVTGVSEKATMRKHNGVRDRVRIEFLACFSLQRALRYEVLPPSMTSAAEPFQFGCP